MPVEIRELVIKAVIDSNINDDGEQTNRVAMSGSSERDEIVSECVNQVLRILKRNQQR